MLVSIITVAYNSADTISRTIESVLNQTYDEIEYIIIDGASSDGTADVARSYLPAFAASNGKTLQVISEPDKGMYDALNKGAALAHGEIVGQINADDWYEPEAVAVMAEHYRKTSFDIAWADLRILKPSGTIIKKAFLGKLWTTAGFNHPTMFSRRELLLEFPYACEHMDDDFDMVTRAKLAGKKIILTHGILANYTFGGMSTAKSLKNLKNRIRMKYATYRRYGFSRLYWFYCAAMETAKFILG